MSTTFPPLDQVRLVRCTPVQARVAVHNDPPDAPEDLAALLARAEAEPSDVATWALVPSSHPDTLDLLSHCVTYRRTAIIASPIAPNEQSAMAYGVSAVFTPPAYRKQGYARRMLQLLHYVLAPPDSLPPFPAEFGAPPHIEGFGDAALSFLHSGIDGAFYAQCTQGVGNGARSGWVPRPPQTRLWRVPDSNSNSSVMTEYAALGADQIVALQGEYDHILRGKLAPGQFAVIPDLYACTIRSESGGFGAKLKGGWFTYIKLRPAEDMAWRITLSLVHGDVPFAVAAEVARREGAAVIEYGGDFTDWDEQGVEIDNEWPKPCYCIYGDEELEWVAPEGLIIEAVGVPGHWAWY